MGTFMGQSRVSAGLVFTVLPLNDLPLLLLVVFSLFRACAHNFVEGKIKREAYIIKNKVKQLGLDNDSMWKYKVFGSFRLFFLERWH